MAAHLAVVLSEPSSQCWASGARGELAPDGYDGAVLRAFGTTDKGQVRATNEDYFVIDESLRLWVRRTEASREREAVGMTDAERIVHLEREVRELRRANEILKAASAFFARELDPQPRR